MNLDLFDFNSAVNLLDGYLQNKTTHSTKAIFAVMKTICGYEFTDRQDQQDFANICSNFEKYATSEGKTAIGRKQFEKWWEEETSVFAVNYDMLPEDPLPPEFQLEEALNMLDKHAETVNNDQDCVQTKQENGKLKEELTEAYRRITELEDRLKKIGELIRWGRVN